MGAHGAGEAEMSGAMGGGNPPDPETVALIRRLEEALLVPEVRKSAAQIAALLTDEFVEIGSSGRIYDKNQINRAASTGVWRRIAEDGKRFHGSKTRRRLDPGDLPDHREWHGTKLDLEEDKFRVANGISSGDKVGLRASRGVLNPTATVHLHLLGKPSA
jgi:hypothetical protein